MNNAPSLDDDIAELEPAAELTASEMVRRFSKPQSVPSNEDTKPRRQPNQDAAKPRPPKRKQSTDDANKVRGQKSSREEKATGKKKKSDPSVTLSTKVAYSVQQKLSRVRHERALKDQEFSTVKGIVEEGLRLFFQKHGHSS